MINFTPQDLPSPQADDKRPFVDFEFLYDQLWQSFVACGYCDSWLADDILLSLVDYYHVDKSDEIDDTAIRQSLLSVLYDNGLEDVANHYASEHLNENQTELQKRLEKVMRSIVDFPHSLEREIMFSVEEIVKQLPYVEENISDSLIRELFLSEFQTHSPELIESSSEEKNPCSEKILLPHQGEQLHQQPEYFWYPDILHFSTGGYIFNSLRVDLFPLESLNGEPLMEMQFFNNFEKIFTESQDFLSREVQELSKKVDYIIIHIHELEALTKSFSAKEQKIFNEEFHRSLEKFFINPLSPLVKSVKFHYSKRLQ